MFRWLGRLLKPKKFEPFSPTYPLGQEGVLGFSPRYVRARFTVMPDDPWIEVRMEGSNTGAFLDPPAATLAEQFGG